MTSGIAMTKSKFVSLITLTVFVTVPVRVYSQCSGSWGSCVPNANCHQVSWQYNQATSKIVFTLKSNILDTEWMGIGFSSDKFMTNTDTIVGWHTAGGTTTLLDGWTSGYAMPTTDTTDVSDITGSKENGITTITFSRAKTTTENNVDFQFSDTNCAYFIYPRGGTYDDTLKTFTKHSSTPTVADQKTCIICPLNPAFGDFCLSSGNPCSGSNVVCNSGKCWCTSGTYEKNGDCNTTDNLKVTVTTETVTSNSIQISWTQPEENYIERYEVTWSPNTQGSSLSPSPINKGSTATINGLSPGTSYTVTVTSVDTNSIPAGAQSVSSMTTIATNAVFGGACVTNSITCSGTGVVCNNNQCWCTGGTYVKDGNCYNTDSLKVTITTGTVASNSIGISWNQPEVNYVERYEVTWFPNTQGSSLSPLPINKGSTATINGLSPGTSYTVTVTSVDTNSIPAGAQSVSSMTTIATNAVFGGTCGTNGITCSGTGVVCNNNQCWCTGGTYVKGGNCYNTDSLKVTITTGTVASNSIGISWNQPEVNYVERYEVTWFPNTQGSSLSPLPINKGSTATINGLSPGTSYTVTVTSVDTNSIPAGAQSVSSMTTIATNAVFGGACVTNSITCSGTGVVCNNNQCWCTGGTYVKDGNCYNTDGLKVTISTGTVTSNSIQISWNQPDVNYVERYEVTWSPNTQGSSLFPSSINKGSTATISGLSPGTSYTVTVTSVDTNSIPAGAQSVSSMTTIATYAVFNGDCSSATCEPNRQYECQNNICKCVSNFYEHDGDCVNTFSKLKVRNPTTTSTQSSVTISWNAPEHVASVNRIEVTWTPPDGGSQPFTITSPSTVTTATIGSLQPGGSYSFTVTSVDSSSRLPEQKQSVIVNVTTGTLVDFDGSCSNGLSCNTANNLICSTAGQCKCKASYYEYQGVCYNDVNNLQVINPVVNVASTQTSLTISWTLPVHASSVDRIEVTWTGGQSPITISNPLTTTSATIPNLLPGKSYSITIKSIDTSSRAVDDTLGTSIVTIAYTESPLGGSCEKTVNCIGDHVECNPSFQCQCAPSYYDDNNAQSGGSCKPDTELKVTNVAVLVTGTTTASVTWKNPAANNAVESRIVKWSGPSGSEKSVAVNIESTNIDNLVPGGQYTFTVESQDTNSRHVVTTVSSDQKIVTAKPAKPGDFTNTTTYLESVYLVWGASDGAVDYYTVVLKDSFGGTKTNNTINSQPSIIIASLIPGRRYNITITAHSDTMTSDPLYGTARTTVTAPGAPTGLKCVPMDTSVTLSWTAPSNPNGDITNYLVNVKSGPGSPRTIDTLTSVLTQEVHNLTEENNYSFTVITVNDGPFNSVESIVVSCKTKAGIPLAPQTLTPVSTTSRSFTISWDRPLDTKGHLIGYRILIENGTTCAKEILFRCSICNVPMFNSTCDSDNKIPIAMNYTDLNKTSHLQEVTLLSPYIDYKVTVRAITEAGDGWPNEITVKTEQDVPQDISDLNAEVLNSTAIRVTWDIPGPRPGITTYTITVTDDSNDGLTRISPITVTGFYERTKVVANLEEYWQYFITVKAETPKGPTPEKAVKPNKTSPAAPGLVDKFVITHPVDDNYRLASVAWNIPKLRDQNSEITSYRFKHNVTGKDTDATIPGGRSSFQQNLNVTPETYYYIEVIAVNAQNQDGSPSSTVYYAAPGPPPNFGQGGVEVVQQDKTNAVTKTTAPVLLHESQLLNAKNGIIVNNGLIVCPKDSPVSLQNRRSADFDLFAKWKNVKNGGCYRPTNSTWLSQAKTVTVVKRSTHERKSYVIGQDAGCDNRNDFCNGPLNPGTDYKVYIFVCTKGGCTSSTSISIITLPPDEQIPIGIIAGVAAAVVVILIVIIIVAVFLKKRRARKGTTHKKFDELDDVIDPTENIVKNRPFQLTDCAAKVADLHRDANLKFAAEYEDIKALSPKHEVEAAELDQNRLKNRYVNILPFDHSRVKLLPTDDDPCTDFINANYLPGYNSQREYIGTQGPIPGTIDDFWRMVWEQNVGIIVMLTLLKEEGRIKCECYWPTEKNDPKQYGELVVETISYSTVNFYDFRIFKLKLGDKTRTLKHFHFLNWKDFSANVQNDVMIDFIQNVRSHVQPPDKQGPIIVHCSAGVGRTGTYICLDHLMQFIDEHDLNTSIDIFDLVLKLRENRSFMVQTEQQYVFIHDCVKDIVERKRVALQNQGGDDLYINQENLYENRAFEPEENLYQNVTVGGDPKTEL